MQRRSGGHLSRVYGLETGGRRYSTVSEQLEMDRLPREWDWRNVNGVNYVSPVRWAAPGGKKVQRRCTCMWGGGSLLASYVYVWAWVVRYSIQTISYPNFTSANPGRLLPPHRALDSLHEL